METHNPINMEYYDLLVGALKYYFRNATSMVPFVRRLYGFESYHHEK